MDFMFALDQECPIELRRQFFAALKSPATRSLADQVSAVSVALHEAHGRIAEIRLAVLVAAATGASVDAVMRDRLDEVRKQHAGMKQAATELKRFGDGQAALFQNEISECSAATLTAPDRIAALRRKIAGFEQARADMRERLASAGLDDEAIERAGVQPTHEERAEWLREIASLERLIQRARAFMASAPLYDVTLLSGE